jgi:hypothetical protein
MQDPRKYYSERIGELEQTIGSLRKRGDRIGWLRLLVAILVVATIYPSVTISLYFLWILLALIIVFLRLVQVHVRNMEEIDLLTAIIRLCRDEVRLANGDHHVFDDGSAPPHHIYANDLDIFGTTSLFKEANRTVTFEGRRLIVDALLNPPGDIDLIEQRSSAISDMADRASWRQHFFAIGTRSGESEVDMSNVRTWLGLPGFFEGRNYWLWIAGAVSMVSVTALLWMILTSTFLFGLLIGILVVNSAIFQLIARDTKRYFTQFGSKTVLFRKFARMFDLIVTEKFESELARDLSSRVSDASHAFLKLSRLHNLAEQRANNLVAFMMNGLFLFDLWTIARIENWRNHYRDLSMPWLSTMGYIDMLSSCANFKFNHPTFTKAEITDSPTPFLKARGLAHPLISAKEAVVNDYEIGIDTKAHVITGSNMAGKSTFIRAVGLNVVLALNGLPVAAGEFKCSLMRIASCIRITDSLEDHASYFKAELDRLRVILDLLREGDSYVVLLDEILRGTNSDDKHNGTLSFYRKLQQYNCICLLATHDLSIGTLATSTPAHFANYCFESTVEGTELRFDYKLRPGVSKAANATFLMKKLDLID